MFLLLFLCIILVACSSGQETDSAGDPEEALAEESAAVGDAVEGEYIEVTARNSSEPVKKSRFDVIAQAEAAKERGENVNIQIS